MERITSLILVVVLVLIVREFRVGKRVVENNPNVQLKPRERFRTLRLQMLEPVVAIVVVGSLLVTDLEREPVHALVALVGGVAGFAFGAYRARTTYVASVPAHRGLILLLSFEAVVALAVLLVIKVVAEQNLLPDGDIFRVVLAGLLGFLLVESCARVYTLMGYYRRDEAAVAASS